MKPSREEILRDVKVISSEFRYPTPTSAKKRWYLTIQCEKCGSIVEKVFQRSTWNFMCNSCGKGRRTTEDFITKAIETHGDKYTYSNVNYINNDTKVTVTCHIHGDWSVRPPDFLGGGNCPKCSKEEVSKSLEYTKEQWESLLNNRLVTIKSKNSRDFGTFTCKHHGEYIAKFTAAVASPTSSCEVCSRLLHQPQSKRENLLDSIISLYWVYIPKIDMYKLGCTVQDIQDRFSKEGKVNILWTYLMPYSEGIDLEHRAHAKFTRNRYSGSLKLLEEGTNELYHENIFHSYEKFLYMMST